VSRARLTNTSGALPSVAISPPLACTSINAPRSASV
jgi:hypothetical protein